MRYLCTGRARQSLCARDTASAAAAMKVRHFSMRLAPRDNKARRDVAMRGWSSSGAPSRLRARLILGTGEIWVIGDWFYSPGKRVFALFTRDGERDSVICVAFCFLFNAAAYNECVRITPCVELSFQTEDTLKDNVINKIFIGFQGKYCEKCYTYKFNLLQPIFLLQWYKYFYYRQLVN